MVLLQIHSTCPDNLIMQDDITLSIIHEGYWRSSLRICSPFSCIFISPGSKIFQHFASPRKWGTDVSLP